MAFTLLFAKNVNYIQEQDMLSLLALVPVPMAALIWLFYHLALVAWQSWFACILISLFVLVTGVFACLIEESREQMHNS